jgi:hypothetical protein
MSARALQEIVVCAHFGCGFVDAMLATDDVTDAERAAFRAVDPRAFRCDAERQHRAIAAVLEELPVTIAIAGLDAAYALFHDVEGFGAVVRRHLPMSVCFAERLVPLAGDAARLEGAVARARRRHGRGLGVARADGVEVVEVGATALVQWQQARVLLGDDGVGAVGRGQRVPRLRDDDERCFVLVEPAAGSWSIAGCSAPLAGLLQALDVAVDEATAVAVAKVHGCDDDDEARALLNDLVADGLLCRRM